MLDCGHKFQNGHRDITFAIVHQFLNSADTVGQNETSVVHPSDLEMHFLV